MSEKEKRSDVLDLTQIFKKIWECKKLFIRVLGITFVVSLALIFCVPRYYVAEVRMAPEMAGMDGGGALGSIVSSFGLNLADMQSSDAISPLLYPDVIASNDFIVGLLDIPVETADGSVKCTYFDYMSKHFKQPFWTVAKAKTIGFFKSFLPKKEEVVRGGGGGSKLNPFWMTKFQAGVFYRISEHVSCAVDKKTGVISISVKAQDALVAATMADSVQAHLQDYIIKYRTSKARVDVNHYEELVKQTRDEYDVAVRKYSDYCDRHQNVILQSYISERDKLENEMQTRYSTYSAMLTQLEASKAKLQERTPAFTMIQSPSVPVLPAGPRRMLFVVGMVLLAGMITLGVVFKKDIGQAIEELK